jgi:LysR family glycine cleavage system transcriptional activator
MFEAAARHLSFTRAADELCVTQGAVSQQIKVLEEQMGLCLFRRVRRGLLLTDSGQELAQGVGEAFAILGRTVDRLGRQDMAGPLAVTTMPSFAAKVLVPRLGGFIERHPEVELRIHTSAEVVDLRNSDIDVALRHGPGRYPGLFVEHLCHEDMFPVCSPDMALRLNCPADLAKVPLIRDQDIDWKPWLDLAGVVGVTPHGPLFLDTHLALQAAMEGQGVALGRSLVAATDLEAGRLVRPFSVSVAAPIGYWLVCLPGRALNPRVKAFRDWLTETLGTSTSG